MPTLSLAAPRPGSGPDLPSDRCTWCVLLGPRQGFAMSDTWAHLPLPWGLQLEPCHRLAPRGGREGGGSGAAGGMEAGPAHEGVVGVGSVPQAGCAGAAGCVIGRQHRPKMKESKPAGNWAAGRARRLEASEEPWGWGGVGGGAGLRPADFPEELGPQAGPEPSLGTG